MAAATNTNTAGTPPATNQGTETVPAPIGGGTGGAGTQGTGETEPAAGIDLGTILWLAAGFAVIVVLWRKGYLAAMRKYIGETREQLHKCTWPTLDELKQHIVVVMISSVLLGVFTVISDKIVRFIVWDLLMEAGKVS